MASRRCSHWAVVTGSRERVRGHVDEGLAERRGHNGFAAGCDEPTALEGFKDTRPCRFRPDAFIFFKTALALASETKRWTLAIASISEPSENLEGGVVFFLRASTSAQSTASLLPTDGSDCSASFFLASS